MLRKAFLWMLLLSICAGIFFGYHVYGRHRDLKETLLWMDQTYNPHEGGDNFGRGHGWEIHYVRSGQTEEVAEKFHATFSTPTSCTMVIRGETMAEGAFSENPSVHTSTLSLGDVDPSTITINTDDLEKDIFNCSDQEHVNPFEPGCGNVEVKFLARNGAALISEERVSTFLKLKGKERELKSGSKTNAAWLLVDDRDYAQRFATALKHAVELCGGTASKF